MNDPEMQAKELAFEAHAGQQDKAGRPYTEHLIEVVGVLRQHGVATRQAVAIAWLHDCAEDTSLTCDAMLLRGVPEGIIRGVDFCTDVGGPTRTERVAASLSKKEAMIARAWAGEAPWVWDAMRVKLADRIANVRGCLCGRAESLLKRYVREHAAFRRALHTPMADSMWLELDRLIAVARAYLKEDA